MTATAPPAPTTEVLDPPSLTAVAGPPPYRMTVEFYQRLASSGLIGAKEPVYLWRGRLVRKMTKGREHNNRCARLNIRLMPLLPESWHIRVEQPVYLPSDGAPEPDISIIRGTPDDYEQRDVFAADVGLIVEVADTSLPLDQGEAFEDYARCGIPVYWIVNIPDRTVDVYTAPSGARDTGPSYYAERRRYRGGEDVPIVLDGVEVARLPVREVLP
jgi:Uma2 family endonuclease